MDICQDEKLSGESDNLPLTSITIPYLKIWLLQIRSALHRQILLIFQ